MKKYGASLYFDYGKFDLYFLEKNLNYIIFN